MFAKSLVTVAFVSLALFGAVHPASAQMVSGLSPAAGARNVNTDVQPTLSFTGPAPILGTTGRIRIVDVADGSTVDELDLSIPVSPNPTGRVVGADGRTQAPRPPAAAGPDNPGFQANQIGGVWFHYFPVTVRGDRVAIHPHNGRLRHGRTYRVEIDPGVLLTAAGAPVGLPGGEWRFTTKAAPPSASAGRVVVSADGTGDFDTVQGAIDFAPAAPAQPFEIFIRNGDYEEIVYLTGKTDLTLRGESREGVVVHYPNNSAFNRIRPALSVSNADGIQLSTFTIRNDFIGQAEALLMRGERNIVDRMTLNGSGDAFTTYGSIYMVDSLLTGDGDTILAYASLFCLRCEIRSTGPFTWTRTPQGRHGNVFVESNLVYTDKPLPWSITAENPEGRKTPGVLGRLPRNGAAGSAMANFPHAEMVLINTRTDGVPPEGWGAVEAQPDFDWSNLRLMEFNTLDRDGRPVDLSLRRAPMRALTLPADADLIRDYQDPAFVLGWTPQIR